MELLSAADLPQGTGMKTEPFVVLSVDRCVARDLGKAGRVSFSRPCSALTELLPPPPFPLPSPYQKQKTKTHAGCNPSFRERFSL